MKYDIFIKGKSVDLVALNSKIIEKTNWYRWLNDVEVTKHMQQHYYPNTKEKQFKFFRDEIEENGTKVQLGIVKKSDNLFSGVISLNKIDHLNASCEISLMIGESETRKLQYFVEAVKLICHHAFNTLNMNRVYSGTISKEVDQLFCRILGFKHEGVLKQAVFKDGVYHDVYQHALLRENYKKP
jgi:[ribosomal protein S5]-alanine N-acetyltransferase